jgi:hypothetical protein
MNTNRVRGIVTVVTLTLGISGLSQAQSSPAPEQRQPAAEKKTEAAPKPAAAEPKKKGEGIQVHGHWTIEVKDPDGTVKTHREFENMLNANPTGLNGSQLLADLLMGSAVSGGFGIGLNESLSPSGTQGYFLYSPTFSSFASQAPCGSTVNGVVYVCNATVADSPSAGGFTLGGQYPNAPQGSITSVSTSVIVCTSAVISVASNQNIPTTVAPSGCTPFGVATYNFPFTGTSLASPVSVAQGQTISASVAITFQ